MNHLWQYWSSQTTLSHQSFAGARLKYVPGSNQGLNTLESNRGRLEFDFARLKDDGQWTSATYRLSFFPATIDTGPVPYESPYHLLKSNNQSLRKTHPEVDLPKSLLLENLHEDQILVSKLDPNRSTLLAGLDIDSCSSVIVSAGGPSGNQLYLSHLTRSHGKNLTIDAPQLHANSKPTGVLRTPIQQLLGALFVARTYDSTTLFKCHCPFDVLRRSSQEKKFEVDFSQVFQLKTADTERNVHIDACIGNSIYEDFQFVLLDKKGRLWRTRTNGSQATAFRLGQTALSESLLGGSEVNDWGRCGVYPNNDCLVVAFRNQLNLIDCRMSESVLNLYCAVDDPITDLQRYISHRTSHIRMFSTTSNIIAIDDRQPKIPLLKIEHFRKKDLSLHMMHASQSSWYCNVEGKDLDEEIDEVILWSQKNDVASVYRLNTHSAIPPNVLGQPLGLPLIPTTAQNSRVGLLAFSQKGSSLNSKLLSSIEMTSDGALWHHEVNVGRPRGHTTSEEIGSEISRRIWDVELESRDVKNQKFRDSEANGILVQMDHNSNFEMLCEEFSHSIMRKKKYGPTIAALPCSNFHDPLGFCIKSRNSRLSSTTPQRKKSYSIQPSSSSTSTDTFVDISCTLNHFLLEPYPTNTTENLSTNFSWSTSRLETLLDVSIRSSMLVKNPQEERRGEKLNLRKTSSVINHLMEPWVIGDSPFKHRWSTSAPDTLVGEIDKLSNQLPRSQRSLIDEDVTLMNGNETTSGIPEVLPKSNDKLSDEELPKIEIAKALRTPKTTLRSTLAFTTGSKRKSQVPIPFNISAPTINSISDQISQSQIIETRLEGELNQSAFSQILPGPHGGRSTRKKCISGSQPKKKKRMGGF
ncbi:expressed protein [Phakopsora pachyrhizi]|uniref:Expressed protein n=1 Tax=Phakopsora pachyrhizi TaxID=170000 RepID=A0AAV0AGN9_PHAPC|nr:expressed protein [Phakopsora pachyrhizi]